LCDFCPAEDLVDNLCVGKPPAYNELKCVD